MIDDKAQDSIMEAYERTILNEQGNTIRDVADIYARFLIGDRQLALRQLKDLEKKPIKGIDGTNGLINSVLDPEKGDMSKWNELFANLREGFRKVINKG